MALLLNRGQPVFGCGLLLFFQDELNYSILVLPLELLLFGEVDRGKLFAHLLLLLEPILVLKRVFGLPHSFESIPSRQVVAGGIRCRRSLLLLLEHALGPEFLLTG